MASGRGQTQSFLVIITAMGTVRSRESARGMPVCPWVLGDQSIQAFPLPVLSSCVLGIGAKVSLVSLAMPVARDLYSGHGHGHRLWSCRNELVAELSCLVFLKVGGLRNFAAFS